MKKFLHRIVRVAAVAYPLALLAVIAAFRWIGEGWWGSTIALYLPRIGFALPLPFLVLALLIARAYRWLLSPLLSALIIVGPLMGLHLGGARAATPGATRLTMLQLNMGFSRSHIHSVIDLIRETHPDIVALEAVGGKFETLQSEFSDYTFIRDGELAIGSRLPIADFVAPDSVVADGVKYSAMYARARVTTPGGPVRVYAIHPTSPHSTFDEIRGEGLKSELLTGHALRSENRADVASNTAERLAQLGAIAADARMSPDPVIIAGDTNMPTLSRAFAQLFGDYHDAFAETGRGFGYSYPADKPSWMRIDRILLGRRLRVLSSYTSERRIYKHQAVVSDIELLPDGS